MNNPQPKILQRAKRVLEKRKSKIVKLLKKLQTENDAIKADLLLLENKRNETLPI